MRLDAESGKLPVRLFSPEWGMVDPPGKRQRVLARARRSLSAIAIRFRRTPSDYLLPAAILLLALLIRLHGLGDKPFWLDEVTSLRRATSTLSGLVVNSLSNKHYPSYFLLLWLVAHLSTSQWALRLPSALFGALAAGLTCAIGRRVAGVRSGLVAGLLMALSPFEVQLGQEARSYTLVSCLILTALAGLVRLAETPTTAGSPWHEPGTPRGAWLAYGIGTAAALNVLSVALVWLLASNLAAAAIARQAGAARARFLCRWALTQALVLAAWAPALVAILALSKQTLLQGSSWAPTESVKTIWSILEPVYLLRIPNFITFDVGPSIVPGLSIVIAALAVLGIWHLRRERSLLPVIAAAGLVLPLCQLLLGLMFFSSAMPVLVPRYFAWSAAPFFILVGAGFGRMAGRRWVAAAAALGLACAANLVPYYGYETKPRWDLLASALAAETQPGDVVLLDNYSSYYVLSAFVDRTGLARRGLRFVWRRDQVADLAPGHGLWLVYGRIGQGALKPPEEYLGALAELGDVVREEAIGRYIVLWRIQPKAATPGNQPVTR
jgi:mannosyltransferase